MLVLQPMIFSILHNASLVVQQSMAAIILFIQGVPMGVMFPIGLRLSEKRMGRLAVPWMWAVNGSASVAGSALAIAIAMSAGYTLSLIFGAACYLMAAASMRYFNQQPKP
jgi:hypothetical protein